MASLHDPPDYGCQKADGSFTASLPPVSVKLLCDHVHACSPTRVRSPLMSRVGPYALPYAVLTSDCARLLPL